MFLGITAILQARETHLENKRAASEKKQQDEWVIASANWEKTMDFPGYFKRVLPEYTDVTSALAEFDVGISQSSARNCHNVMLPDGSWWHSIVYRAKDDLEVSRTEVMERLREIFVATGEWRITVRKNNDFGAQILQIGDDDLWCEMIPYYGLYDRDTWCIHLSEDGRIICVYSRGYWGIGRKKPK